jgi:hypothetical protein
VKNHIFLTIFISLVCVCNRFGQQKPVLLPEMYGVGHWEHVDSLGNQRVVVSVDAIEDAVVVDIPWRLRKIGPEKKNVVVVDAFSGERIMNVFPFQINREHGKFAFQPKKNSNKYYVYYLTYNKEGGYYPKVTYYPFENTADPLWVKKNKLTTKGREKNLASANIIKFESINKLNSFYPMEIMASADEVAELVNEFKNEECIFFTEDRKYPVRTNYDIPYKWIEERNINKFKGKADKGEYFLFQIGVFAFQKSINNIKLHFNKIVNTETGLEIPAGNFTCFNTEGIDVTGNYFEKKYSTPQGEVHPLWIGVKIPEKVDAGAYTGRLLIEADGIQTKSIDLNIDVSDMLVANMGDDELWRHSRLRWLNSTIGENNEIVSPFIALKLNRKENSISCLGRKVTLSDNGLPSQITSFFSEKMTELNENGRTILATPIKFVTDDNLESNWEVLNFDYTKVTPGTIAWKTLCKNSNFVMDCEATMDFDGNITYEMTLIATNTVNVDDINLDVSLNKNAAKYMMGLGEKGGYLNKDINWKWEVEKNQDGPWVGDVNAGMQIRYSDTNYERPLNTNFYLQKPLFMPTSWYNNGSGGIKIENQGEQVSIKSYSGKRNIKKGEVFHFNFNIAITPFKKIDTKKQWAHRFYHSPQSVDSIAKQGANTINIHHANKYNPYINYPFLTPDKMKEYVDEAHTKGMKVKFYYTLRELSNSCPELFALRSLGTEVFSEGEGGGYSWLQEHLDQTYIAAWFDPTWVDAAVVNSGVSRWHNYYIEGLNWLVNTIGIDGIYIDDLAFDRTTMKRMRKVLERGNPGTFLDLHSANQYNPRDGFANSANLYLEHMPYIDRLWFGEYFEYDMRPDFWMIEVAGIPYGVMGEMLQDGGNPWRGMLWGMTGRSPRVDLSAMWKAWDDFEIEKSDMIGYWVSDNPVKTNSNDTYVTAYVQKGKQTMLSIATWAETDDTVNLDIDWEELGLEPSNTEFYAPAIDDFQDEKTWTPSDPIVVPKGKGFLIIVRNK